jgi:hypothetical protein
MRGLGSSTPCPLTLEDLQAAGITLPQLSASLTLRGCKAGGTWGERAIRLLAVVGRDPIPKAHLAKK